MISILKNEPIVRRILGISIVAISFIFFVFAIFQYNSLEKIYEEQNDINKRIIGMISNQYPKAEADIVSSIYKGNEEYEDLGEKVLDKYGYDKNYNMSKNINFQQHLKYFLVNNLVIFVVIIVFIIFVISALIKYGFKQLDRLSVNIDNLINNNYILETDYKEEGVFNIIYADLNKLSRSLNIKLKNLDKEKESIKGLVTDISHQLKTPLASLKLYNSLLIEEELDEEERMEFLKTNEKSIDKLHNLIDSLVNISRLETSMISIKKENKDIKSTIIKAIESVKGKASLKNIDITLNDFESKIIPHDAKWTEESIFNILDNAVKYTNISGKIEVEAYETINFYRIDIKDNGIGIDKKEFNNVFKRFYRSEEVNELEGSGVGLYLSRKIVEMQGGNIIVDSKKGQGSKFSLFLTKV